ncbi:MAG: hypothetical protein DDT29_02276 [Dehalococcoidia bacterium]|nr:hypothetical protein [Bacillota bacterium]
MTSIKYDPGFFKGKEVFVGIDFHKSAWTLTAICEGEIVYDGTIPTDFDRSDNVLSKFNPGKVHAVYDAGILGFWLDGLH